MKTGIHILKEHTIAEAAYLAGIIDGEGSIYIGCFSKNPSTGTPYYQTAIEINNTDESLIDWIANTFGGRKSRYTRNQTPKNSRKPVFRWLATGILVDHLVTLVKPYIVIKKRQCEVMLLMRETYKETGIRKGKALNEPIPERILTLREELYRELRALHCRNHTGV
jgi:hypothetical protein